MIGSQRVSLPIIVPTRGPRSCSLGITGLDELADTAPNCRFKVDSREILDPMWQSDAALQYRPRRPPSGMSRDPRLNVEHEINDIEQ